VIVATAQNPTVMISWGKRPSVAPRKQRDEDAARRLLATFPDRYLPDRPSLDGYTVHEVPLDQLAQLLPKWKHKAN
jgi:hypothetical protein